MCPVNIYFSDHFFLNLIFANYYIFLDYSVYSNSNKKPDINMFILHFLHRTHGIDELNLKEMIDRIFNRNNCFSDIYIYFTYGIFTGFSPIFYIFPEILKTY